MKKSQSSKPINFDSNPEARKSLNQILDEGSRHLYPYEVAWLLSLSVSEVYELVPRVKTLNSAVRFDPRVIKSLKDGAPNHGAGSLKTEKADKIRHFPRSKKGKDELCL